MTLTAQSLDERRGDNLNHNEHWKLMSAEQKMTLYGLHPYGYRLLFVRHLPEGPLAVIAQQHEIATISNSGDVNYQPEIYLRD